ncbi:MAG: type II toxin-antitoxin system PemK/MazF family toxin [Patescibacteria group bacterium]
MKRGEIWLVELFESKGHEQSGLRPAVIVSDTALNIVIVIPLTSNLQALRFPYVIQVEPSNKNGLDSVSAVLIFQLRAIDKSRLKRKIGSLEMNKFKEIQKIIKNLLFGN